MTTTVTLDTNVVQEYWRQGARVAIVEALIDLAEDELINLAVTRRIYEDVPHPPLADRISKLDEIGVNLTGSVFRLGISALGSGDMLGSDIAKDVFESVAHNLANQGQSVTDWRDWDRRLRRLVIMAGTADPSYWAGRLGRLTEPPTTSRRWCCLPSDEVQRGAPAVPPYRRVTLQESRVLGALTGYPATSPGTLPIMRHHASWAMAGIAATL